MLTIHKMEILPQIFCDLIFKSKASLIFIQYFENKTQKNNNLFEVLHN